MKPRLTLKQVREQKQAKAEQFKNQNERIQELCLQKLGVATTLMPTLSNLQRLLNALIEFTKNLNLGTSNTDAINGCQGITIEKIFSLIEILKLETSKYENIELDDNTENILQKILNIVLIWSLKHKDLQFFSIISIPFHRSLAMKQVTGIMKSQLATRVTHSINILISEIFTQKHLPIEEKIRIYDEHIDFLKTQLDSNNDHGMIYYYATKIHVMLLRNALQDLDDTYSRLAFYLERVKNEKPDIWQQKLDPKFIDLIISNYASNLITKITKELNQADIKQLLLLINTAIDLKKYMERLALQKHAALLKNAEYLATSDEKETKYNRDIYVGRKKDGTEKEVIYDKEKLKSTKKEWVEMVVALKKDHLLDMVGEHQVEFKNCNKKTQVLLTIEPEILNHIKEQLKQIGTLTTLSKNQLVLLDFVNLDLALFESILKDARQLKVAFPAENTSAKELKASNVSEIVNVAADNCNQPANDAVVEKNAAPAAKEKPTQSAKKKKRMKANVTKVETSLYNATQPRNDLCWGEDFPKYSTGSNSLVYRLYDNIGSYYYAYISPNLIENLDTNALTLLVTMCKDKNRIITAPKGHTGFFLSNEDFSIQTKKKGTAIQAEKHVKVKHCRRDERFFGHVVAKKEVDGKTQFLLEIDTYKPEHKKHGALYRYPSDAQSKNKQSNTYRAKK